MIAATLFLLGLYLSIRSIVALYRILDLWYTIRTAWPIVLRGLLVWLGGTAAIALALPPRLRAPFLWGALGYLAFYVVVGGVGSYLAGPMIARRVRAFDRAISGETARSINR